jgi:hypothetical protein
MYGLSYAVSWKRYNRGPPGLLNRRYGDEKQVKEAM